MGPCVCAGSVVIDGWCDTADHSIYALVESGPVSALLTSCGSTTVGLRRPSSASSLL